MSAKNFIDKLETLNLLDPSVIEELRRQVEQSKYRVKPESLAKVLVENGQLTKFQASRLVAESSEEDEAAGQSNSVDDDLLLADDSNATVENSNKAVLVFDDEDEDDGDEFVAVAVEGDAEEAVAVSVSDTEAVDAVSVVDPIDADVAEVAEVVDVQSDDASGDEAAAYVSPVRTDRIPGQVAGANKWDQWRIYGWAGLLLLLLIPLGFLGYWALKGSAEEHIARADKSYEDQQYERAADVYESFVENFPADEQVSYAKVRNVLAQLRDSTGRSGNPSVPSDLATQLLPTIVTEQGFEDTQQRSDMADVLVEIASKFLDRADKEKETEDKRGYINGYDKHYVLIEDTRYFGGQQKKQNQNKLDQLNEERQRIVRTIQREDDLKAASEKMNELLGQQDVDGIYRVRRELVNKHPELAEREQITNIMLEATALQRGKVVSATSTPKIVTDIQQDSGRLSALLANRQVINELPHDDVVFIRAKGSLYALNARDGQTRWRRYVGQEFVDDPVYIDGAESVDLLLPIREKGILRRISGIDGSLLWQAEFGAVVHEPVVNRDVIYVTVSDGRVYALDADTGATKWGKQLPQKLEVGVGVGPRGKTLYVPGVHSNLYTLSQDSGDCIEVTYVGHLSGSIRVPPVYGLNHVFVFDNTTSAYSRVHIYYCDDDGTNVRQVQNPIRMVGQIVVPATMLKRRLTIVSDLGEIQVLDVEPSNEEDKQVSSIGNSAVSAGQPKKMWPLVNSTELWLFSDRYARYRIQVATQELVLEWVKESGDEFIGRPIQIGNYVIHSRRVRGTRGVRVSAVEGDSGNLAWQVDLGVPVSALKLAESGGGLVAVSSQAALFSVGREGFSGNGSVSASSNPGQFNRSLMFDYSVPLDDGGYAMVNRVAANQIAVLDSTGANLRVLKTAAGKARVVAEPVYVSGALIVPLDNGQIVAIDPATGQSVQSPFQPVLSAGEQVRYLVPAVLSDKQTLVVADNRKRLYRVATGSRLRNLNEVTLDLTLTERLATLGDSVVGVAQDAASDSLVMFNGIDLSQIAKQSLAGRVKWGPFVTGGLAVVCTDSEGLVAMDTTGEIVWRQPFDDLSLYSKPVQLESDWLIASKIGKAYRLNANDGSISELFDFEEPLTSQPIIRNSGGGVIVFVPSEDGLVFGARVQ